MSSQSENTGCVGVVRVVRRSDISGRLSGKGKEARRGCFENTIGAFGCKVKSRLRASRILQLCDIYINFESRAYLPGS